MTAKCANPDCNARFVYFRTGKIFLVPCRDVQSNSNPGSPKREMEYFWLCGDCCRTMRLTLQNGVITLDSFAPPIAIVRKPDRAHL